MTEFTIEIPADQVERVRKALRGKGDTIEEGMSWAVLGVTGQTEFTEFAETANIESAQEIADEREKLIDEFELERPPRGPGEPPVPGNRQFPRNL